MDLFDQFLISGDAVLNGTLNISLIDAFLPSVGDTFEIMEFGSHLGTFDTVNGLDLGGGLFLDAVFANTSLTLVTQQSGANPIPEPSTLVLFAIGIIAMLWYSRHRQLKVNRGSDKLECGIRNAW